MNSSKQSLSVGPLRSGSASSLLNSSRILDALARSSGWLLRKTNKLTPKRFLQALVACVCSGQCCLRQLAIEVGLLLGDTYSKQALWKRIDAEAVAFVKEVVARALRFSAASIPTLDLDALPGVGRILVGDSSTFTFHSSLREHFPGATNQHGVSCAQCRFQLCFDLLGGKWLQAQVDPYQRGDRSAAGDIVQSLVGEGDLIIRDLGYAVSAVFGAIAAKGAFFLSRLNTTAAIYDEAGRRIDVLKLATERAPRPGESFSMDIRLTHKHRLPCRLIVRNDGEAVGAIRRRRIKKQGARQGINHRQDYLRLQNWTLLVTNLEQPGAQPDRLCELYALRWRVENIFKLAKSQTSLRKLLRHRSNRHHAEVLLWAWVLVMVCMGMKSLFALADMVAQPDGKTMICPVSRSLFKAIDKLLQWSALSIELAAARTVDELFRRLITQCAYHDRYEKRHKRISMPQRLKNALAIPDLGASLS